jgi:5-methylcytosine-specific restriction endonuclease McrA
MDSVIVLNRNFEFWTEVPLKKVLKWIAKDKIEVVVTHETAEVGSISIRMKLPLVVRLLKFVGYKPHTEVIVYSDEAVFARDNYTCQYYHIDDKGRRFRYKCTEDELTIDHVIPKSREGKSNDFLNAVCACKNCNENIKKNKTPKEAGLELIRIPVIPRRDKNSFVVARFKYNPRKLAHKKYYEKVLGIL